MAYLLALETSSTICSVALFRDDYLLGLSELQIEKSHSSHITVLIQQLLDNCQVPMASLSAVALSGGPGSYTGLRIGSSTAKGLCYSLDIPLIEVSTLQAMAAAMVAVTPQAAAHLFCPMIDARRMEVYTCLVDHELNEVMPVMPLVLEENAFKEQLAQTPIIFAGSGADKFKALVGGEAQARFLEAIKPSARFLGGLALAKFNRQAWEDVAYYEPFYLKEVYITSSSKNKQ